MTKDIDFLPVTHLEAGVHRKNFTLRVTIASVFLAMLAFAALFQQHLRTQAEAQLAELLPQYYQAVADTKKLTDLQRHVRTAEKQAELLTYLQNPWPRSRILSTLSESMPDEIELERVAIVREMIPVSQEQNHAAAPAPTSEAPVKLDPAEHDLMVLREEWDKTQVVITITGVTDDPAALHRFLERLNQAVLFSKVDLSSEERINGDSAGRMRFMARLIVKPGYGQPGGPRPTETKTTDAQMPQAKAG
jgi:Tfp pilus assembly protein PilN